jgi:hypothetical protein
MKLTYNGVVIAAEPPDGGTDAVTGFKPKGVPLTQKSEPIRARYATTIPRGNRLVTLTGVIAPTPGPTLEAALIAAETMYGSLPDSGDLVKTINGSSVTYPGAVLGPFEVLEDFNGVSYGFRLTFFVGQPSADSPGGTLGTEPGVSLGTESGDSFGTET